jgi:hypothetical protein
MNLTIAIGIFVLLVLVFGGLMVKHQANYTGTGVVSDRKRWEVLSTAAFIVVMSIFTLSAVLFVLGIK